MNITNVLDIFDQYTSVPGDFPSQANHQLEAKTQLAVSFTIGMLCFLLFCILRLKCPVLYSPREKLTFNSPKKLPPTLFSWVWTLIKIDEKYMLKTIGLDAVLHLRFFKMSSLIFGLTSIYGLLILMPLNYRFSSQNAIILTTDIPEDSNFFIAHLFGIYLYTFIFLYVIFRYYQIYTNTRWNFLIGAKKTVTARSLVVYNLPRSLRRKEALKRHFEKIKVGEVEDVVLCNHSKILSGLIKKRADVLLKLEKAITKWLKNPCTEPIYDPNEIYEYISKNKASKNEKYIALSKKLKRPVERTGFLGIFGKKVDSIEYHSKNFHDLSRLVKLHRNLSIKNESNIGFITFKSIHATHIISQIINNSSYIKCNADLAPEPRDIYWKNINVTRYEFIIRNIAARIFTILLTFFWGIPTSVLSSAITIDKLVVAFPMLKNLESSPIIWSLFTGFLPTTVTIIFFTLIPYIMNVLSVFQGNRTYSQIQKKSIKKHFAFLLVNVLLSFTVSKTLISTVIRKLVSKPTGIINLLAQALPQVSVFFLNYVMILGIGYFPLKLLQLGTATLYFFQNILCKTPRDYANILAPTYTDYGLKLGLPMIVFVVSMTYSIICPLITVCGFIYFMIGYFVEKYLLIYYYFHSFETGGLIWPIIFPRIVLGPLILQLTMTGFFVLKNRYAFAVAIAPLLSFNVFCIYMFKKMFPNNGRYLPSDYWVKNQTTSTHFSNDSEQILPITNIRQSDSLESSRFSKNSSINSLNINITNLELVDDQQYMAEATLKTDYHQSTMSRYYGVLNSGIINYGNPSIHGILPYLWVPQKFSKIEIREYRENVNKKSNLNTFLRNFKKKLK